VQPFGSSQHFMEPKGSLPSLQELIHALINSILYKDELRELTKESIIIASYKKCNKTDLPITVGYHYHHHRRKMYPILFSQKLSPPTHIYME
jgi:hypothetical protein